MVTDAFARLREELEIPRALRHFGSGWLSGSGALLCGIVALAMVISLRFPWLLTTPELTMIRDTAAFRTFLHVVLIMGYVFALLRLLLRKEKVLGFTALVLVMAAALMGGSQAEALATKSSTIYFGLDFFVVNVLFLGFIFIPLERIIPHNGEQTVFRPEWQEDIFYYVVSSLLVQILAFLTMAPSNAVNAVLDPGGFRATIGALPFVVQILAIMLFTDVLQYWVHRLFHTIPFLWKFHAVHHSAKTMDWIAGARMHFAEIIVLRSVTALPMFTLGFTAEAVQAYILIVYILSSFVHANIRLPWGSMERYIVMPRFHHWHHGIEKEAIDVNFSIHFPLIDRIFGTYYLPGKDWPSGYGIADHPVPQGYWKQFLYPFKSKGAN